MAEENNTEGQELNFELRSDEVREIMGKLPHWMIRNGIAVILISLLILLWGSFYFKYPDKIKGMISITSENPPANLLAKSSGKISMLFVKDNQQVKKNEILAVIENPASFNDMSELMISLKPFSSFFLNNEQINPPEINITGNIKLGECQDAYASFMKNLGDYLYFIELNYYPKKIRSLEDELQMQTQYLEKLNGQRDILEENLNLSRKDFNRDSILFTKGIIPQADYEKRKSEFLNHRYDYENSQYGWKYISPYA